jgi:protein-S-isoprenylcysteine O-methyltransferase Ste14
MTDPRWWKGTRGEWYVIIQFLLLGLVAVGPKWIPNLPAWPPPWSLVGLAGGAALGAIGLVLIGAGLWALGPNLTPMPHPKDDATLVETGAYRLLRHPIYGGLLYGAFGWALINASTLTLLYAAVLFIFFDLKSRREEKWLAKKLPAYADYQRRVRKFIPFIY